MVKHKWLLSAVGLMVIGIARSAQAQVPSVPLNACQALARQSFKDVEEVKQLDLQNTPKTRLYRYNDKIGSQFIDSELLGTGRYQVKRLWKTFSYLCLLGGDQKALYFRILTQMETKL